ncbi:MAG: DUF1080 domain-containing protein [Verrucomicrobiota bacterium]
MLKRNVALIVALAGYISGAGAEEKPELKSMFNGKDLSGWTEPKDNIWFSVGEDGILVVKNGPRKKGATLWTESKYRNFVMEFDFRMGEGTVDSGIFIRNNREQIQIGISGSLKRDMTASPYIAGKGYPVEAEGVKELLKLKDWNTMRIKAVGKVYTTWLNGKQVMTYESPSAKPEGAVGIQLHGNRTMHIDYRNLKLAELPADS